MSTFNEFNKKRVIWDDVKDCTGCGVCKEVCPVNAIFDELIDDFYYPVIDESKCIECNKCINICPIKKNNEGFYRN